MNYLLIARYWGYFAVAIGVLMAVPSGVSLIYGEPAAVRGFALSILCCIAAALVLIWLGRKAPPTIFQREALGMVGTSWILAAGLGALPFVFAGELRYVDAFFETMSGLTTTGSTIISDIEAMPKGLLFWRSFTHWVGGLGIVVLFIAVLPYLGAGGKQLFRAETTGPMSNGLRPRIRDTATFLYKVYIGLTILQIVLLLLARMPLFDAVTTTFASLGTGGFSPRQDSIGAYDSLTIEIIVIVFMLIGGTNFSLFFLMARGQWSAPWRDTEWRVYMLIFVVCTLLIAINLAGVRGHGERLSEYARSEGFEAPRHGGIESQTHPFGHALRVAAFQVSSIMTTTGFVTDDFEQWPSFSRMLLVTLMFIGACGGSTGGGFKIVRVIMLLKMAYWRLEMSFRPKTIRALRISGEVVDDETQRRVAGFFVLYLLLFVVGSLFLSALGLPFQSATTAVITTMNNVGPGFELVGAMRDFSVVPDAGKWFLSFCMIAGRLEIFTIFVLLVPSFWRGTWRH